jgi:ferric-dicitrate binding protein FerR (iron transport regulator)
MARIAAIIVLMLGSSYLIVSRFSTITSFLTGKMIVASDPANGKSIRLPDGSQVHMNASSRIVYSENKKEHTREVRLTGEAFFNVLHDEENPFIVTAGNALIRVTGTSFNIRADDYNGQVSVFVESGSVEVSHTGSDLSPVIIEAGFSGLVTATKIERINTIDPNLLSWKTRNLVFNETKMTEVLEALNHTYHRNIICREKQIMDFRFTGNFNDQPVDTILQVLCTAFHLEAESRYESIELRLED